MTWKDRFVQFSWKARCLPVLARISGQCDDFENFHAQNAIWPKRASHDLKNAFCTIFIETALFSVLKRISAHGDDFENFNAYKCDLAKPCSAWPERQFCTIFRKSALFPVLKTIWRQCDDFENFDAHECDLAKTCFPWPKKSVLLQFSWKAHFPRFGENFRPVWRFWELWGLKMRFAQNVLRMTWKERFVQF